MKTKKRSRSAKPSFSVLPENITDFIKLQDIRNLVLWILSEQQGPPAPSYMRVQNRAAINHVISLSVPGLFRELFQIKNIEPKPIKMEPNEVLPSLNSFEFIWPTELSPSTIRKHRTPVVEFMKVSCSKAEKKRQEMKRKHEEASNENATKKWDLIPPETFLLTDEQRSQFEYSNEARPGWIRLLPRKADSEPCKIYALDCEMCETASGAALTRIAVIDYDENRVFAAYVMPEEPITDYLTPYSGITADILENNPTLTLNQVQNWFSEHVFSDDILIGHSMNNDLDALKIIHDRVIDTAFIFAHPRGLPWRPSLKWLSNHYLGLQIQTGDDGHNPDQDALAALKLFKLKQGRGSSFGSHTMTTSIPEILAKKGISTAIVDYGVPNWDQGYSKTVISCSSDREVIAKMLSACNTHRFIYGSLQELSMALRSCSRDDEGHQNCGTIDLKHVYEELDSNLQKLISSVPENTAVLIWSAPEESAVLHRLLDKKSKVAELSAEDKMKEAKQSWTVEDEDELRRKLYDYNHGISFQQVFNVSEEHFESPPKKLELKKI